MWKWSAAITAVVLSLFAWQCGSAFVLGRRSADSQVEQFHHRMNGNQYGQICTNADDGFADEKKCNDFTQLLQVIHEKLGDAKGSGRVNMSVNVSTGGIFVIAQYNSTFAHGSALETFTWAKKKGVLKLYGYHVQSNALVANRVR